MRRLFLFLSLVIFAGCNSDDETYYLDDEGVVWGIVYTEDSSAPVEGVTVFLHGLHYNQKIQTSEHGSYQFDNVHSSTYEIEFSAPGYGTIRKENIRQSGRDTIQITLQLYQIPDYPSPKVENPLARKFFELYEATFVGTTEVPGKYRAFFSTAPDVSPDNYKWTFFFESYEGVYNYNAYLPGFRTTSETEPLYMVLFPDGGGSYYDFRKDKLIFSALNLERRSKVIHFIVE